MTEETKTALNEALQRVCKVIIGLTDGDINDPTDAQRGPRILAALARYGDVASLLADALKPASI